ncbi:hypothetical protein NX02_29230 [Sphingomonas sanxanigenens DSM 19645 = NX02]|nr:hypothetical protein NX02_29230 [Sphingomonas sanxanigenens DSM 19645 = NX02]
MGGALPIEPLATSAIRALCNPEAELYLIEELIADNKLIEQAADEVRAVDFSAALHARIFTRMIAEHASGRRVEAITLEPFFREDEDWISGKMFGRLSGADINASRDRSRIRGYVDHLVELSKRRRLVAGLQDAIASARTIEVPLLELATHIDEAVAVITEAEQTEEHGTLGEYAAQVIADWGKPIHGVRSGLIKSLDDVTGTLETSDTVVVAGGTGMGKTAFASSYAIGVAQVGQGVLMISQEMTGVQLARRAIADASTLIGQAVDHRGIRNQSLDGEHMMRMTRTAEKLSELPIEVVPAAGMTVDKLRRVIRRQRRRFQAKGTELMLVVVDYLQLMQPSRAGMSAYESATEISKGLKLLAGSENVVMMALSQLNRNMHKRASHKPELADLRDSGQIEQDASTIILLHREEQFVRNEEPKTKPRDSLEYTDWETQLRACLGRIEFIVPKSRHGTTGKALGWFFGKYQAVRGNEHDPSDYGGFYV